MKRSMVMAMAVAVLFGMGVAGVSRADTASAGAVAVEAAKDVAKEMTAAIASDTASNLQATVTAAANSAAVAAVEKVAEKTSKFAGYGHEIGTMVRETISSLVDGVDKGAGVTIDRISQFSQTGVGKGVIAMIVWKVCGADIVRIIWALFLAVCLFIIVRVGYTRIYVGKMVVVKQEGKTKTYARQEPLIKSYSSNDFPGSIVLWILLMAVDFIALSATIGNIGGM